MIKQHYLKKIIKQVNNFSEDSNSKFFIFGSSLYEKHFGDIDLGVLGDINKKKIYQLKEIFEDSTLPYSIDIINFNKVSKEFKNNVFNNKVLWIRR